MSSYFFKSCSATSIHSRGPVASRSAGIWKSLWISDLRVLRNDVRPVPNREGALWRHSLDIQFCAVHDAMGFASMAQPASIIQLKPDTLEAFGSYVREAESAMQASLDGSARFLWTDEKPDRARRVREGNIPARLWSGQLPVHVPDGLIHDWIGAVAIPHTTLELTLARVQDYDNHKVIYKPEVMESRLLSRHGNDFTIFLRLLKKKIITVVMDTEHEVHYQCVSERQWFCRSYTTRCCEVDDAGTAKEKIYPPDVGYGFLWRLFSYWRFAADADGVIVECRALSLTRDVPLGLGFVVEPIIKNLPRESLVNTLRATRQALAGTATTVAPT